MTEIAQKKMPKAELFCGDMSDGLVPELGRADAGEAWDEDEIYVVVDELKKRLSGVIFHKITFCSGVIEIKAY